MATASRVVKLIQTETDVAVLKVQVKNIEDKVDDLKGGIKDMNTAITKSSDELKVMLKEMSVENVSAHKAMSDKISTLERWRWMMMGAGIVIGSLGFDTVAKLLK